MEHDDIIRMAREAGLSEKHINLLTKASIGKIVAPIDQRERHESYIPNSLRINKEPG